MDRDSVPVAVVAAAGEAVRAYLRGGAVEADGLVERMALAAIELFEGFAGEMLIAREVRVTLGASGAWQRLGAGPVRAIVAVEGLPAEGAGFALPVGAYAIDIDAHGDGWVRVGVPGIAGRVRVTMVAGLHDGWDAVPAPVAHGIVLLAAHLIEGRSDVAPPPAAVSALWRPYRRMRLAAEAVR